MTGSAEARAAIPPWLAELYARDVDCPPHTPGTMRLPDTPAGTCSTCLHPRTADCHPNEGATP